MAKGTAYGVTGSSRLLTPTEGRYVRKIVHRAVLGVNRRYNTLVSGMAYGVDTEAIIAVWGLIPFENIICAVPGTAPHNYGLVEKAAKLGAQVITVENRHTVGETYLARDDLVVKKCKVLLAFPHTPKEVLRSGTWSTIRRARKADNKIRYYPLTNARHSTKPVGV